MSSTHSSLFFDQNRESRSNKKTRCNVSIVKLNERRESSLVQISSDYEFDYLEAKLSVYWRSPANRYFSFHYRSLCFSFWVDEF